MHLRTMKAAVSAVSLAALTLLTAACGKEGAPGGAAGSDLSYPVAKNVTVAGSTTFDRATKAKKLVVGVKADQPNLGYKDLTTGTYSGFDVEIARMIAAGLGFDPKTQLEFRTVPSANREAELSKGSLDYYVGTYSITEKRKKLVSFAGPYLITGQGLLVSKDSPITGPNDVKGKRVCSVTGSTPLENIRKYAPAEASGLDSYSLCFNQLLQNQTDALTTDESILKGYAAQDPTKVKLVGEKFTTEKYGVGLGLQDKALRDKINDLLEAAAKDNTWQKIYDATLGKSGSKDTAPALERY